MRSHNHTKLGNGLFREEYTPEFVDRWDELINWRKRYEAENGFFQRILADYGARKVLDIACGTGFHTITLTMAGFDVTGADGSANMLAKAKENADRLSQDDIPLVEAEWTSLSAAFPDERFDAVVCLGNAFTHLFEEEARRASLREIYTLLNDDGVAIIDQRNYDSILDVGFTSKHRYYYTGDSVEVTPEYVTDQAVKLLYRYEDGSVHHLTLCPIRQEYLTALLGQTGFRSVQRYGDFEAAYDLYDPDFIVQVAKK
ncbi:MAG: class I SAM-dependent DNA methyltransferase [Dehalococcoidia bacterium]